LVQKAHRESKKGSKPILWLDRTSAFGLSFPQANTFPVGQIVKLHYNYVSKLSSTGVSGIFMPERWFRLSNIYDPDTAVGGGQPYYYDTLFGSNGTSAPYAQWRVVRSKVDVQFYNDNTSGASACMAGVTVALNLNTTAGTVAATQLMMQRPNTKIVPCTTVNGPQGTPGFTLWVDHAKMMGVKDMKDADDQIGNYNAGPSGNELDVGLVMFPIDTTSDTTIEIWYRLHITYYVECRSVNTVTES